MRATIFLDRDGVINRELGRYTKNIQELEILQHAISNCKKLKEMGYQLIVITNQGGIAKGEYKHEDVLSIHQKIAKEIPGILSFYYCPHHDSLETCLCRKPKSLLIEKAIDKHQVDADKSFMIGDSDRDVQAAEAAGIKGIKINSNEPWDFSIFPPIFDDHL